MVASAQDPDSERGREALAQLCEAYWEPLWAFARRVGGDPERAKDLTQGYLTVLLEKGYLGDVRPSTGRFRTFLLASFKHYLANEHDRERALKRGGGFTLCSLDAQIAMGRDPVAPGEASPEAVFERRWATTVVDRALARLRREEAQSGKEERLARLEPFLVDGADQGAYREVATELGTSAGAVKVAVHRLRRRFGELLRAEIAETVGSREEVDEELRHLLAVLGGRA